jgi:hypothetical protein
MAEEEAGVEAVVEEISSRASTVAEETDGVESDRVESEEDLESFVMKRDTTRSGLLVIRSKISAAVLN